MDPAPLDKPFSEEDKQRFARSNRAAKKHRDEIFWAFENTIAFRYDDGDRRRAARPRAQPHRLPDQGRELKAKLTPDYPFGCKRTLICSDFYKALLRDNVELVTDASTTSRRQAS